MKLIASIFIVCVFAFCIIAQHKIPVGTNENVIELNIKNPTNSGSSKFFVAVSDLPEWIEFSDKVVEINKLNPGENAVARFSFDIKTSAPINEVQSILLQITDENGKSFHKFIDIVVTPPDKFDLAQNYPNPFNPSTKISYLIPIETSVNVSVFNLLGEKVATLVNEEQLPGFYEVEFNAIDFASGIYFYTLKTDNFMSVKKLTLLK